MQPSSTSPEPVTLTTATGAFALPNHLARLVNPDVVAARREVIARRMESRGDDAVLRRQCVEMIASHLT